MARRKSQQKQEEQQQSKENTMSVFVYVSGPLTSPDPWANTNAAILAATKLADAGLTPFCPHLSTLWASVTPRPYEFWMEMDLAWVERCDCILRLPGKSSGADREVAKARSLGKAVWHDVDALIEAHKRDNCVCVK